MFINIYIYIGSIEIALIFKTFLKYYDVNGAATKITKVYTFQIIS